jgi:hypothetical protein
VRSHSDAVLAGVVAFDDADVGVSDRVLDAGPETGEALCPVGADVLEWDTGDAGGGPQHHLGDAMLAHDIRFHGLWGHTDPSRDAHP